MANKKFPFKGISSAAIHAGDKNFAESAHLSPIYASSTFTFEYNASFTLSAGSFTHNNGKVISPKTRLVK